MAQEHAPLLLVARAKTGGQEEISRVRAALAQVSVDAISLRRRALIELLWARFSSPLNG